MSTDVHQFFKDADGLNVLSNSVGSYSSQPETCRILYSIYIISLVYVVAGFLDSFHVRGDTHWSHRTGRDSSYMVPACFCQYRSLRV